MQQLGLLLALLTFLLSSSGGGQKERQREEGQPQDLVPQVAREALHPQQQGLWRGFPGRYLRVPDSAHPVQGVMQPEEGNWSGLQHKFED